MQPRSQRASKWAGIKLGTGSTNKSTIGSHGCTITCVGIAGDLDPDAVNQRLIDKGGFAAHKDTPQTFNLIVWTKIVEAIPWLKFADNGRGYGYDDARVKAAIAKNGFCLVAVNGAPIGGATVDGHWVLAIGNGKIIDPWDGKEKPFTSYSPTGFAIIDRVGEPPASGGGCLIPNTEDGSELFTKLVHNSGIADQTVDYLGLAKVADNVDFQQIKNSLEAREGKLTSCKNELSTRSTDLAKAEQEVLNRTEQVGRLKDQMTEMEKRHLAEITAIKEGHTDPETLLKPYKSRIEQLEEALDQASKDKGRALLELSQVKAELEQAKKGQFGDLTFRDWLALLAIVKWR